MIRNKHPNAELSVMTSIARAQSVFSGIFSAAYLGSVIYTACTSHLICHLIVISTFEASTSRDNRPCLCESTECR